MRKNRDRYLPVKNKFIVSHLGAILWTAFSVYISSNWLHELAGYVTYPIAFLIIAGIAYIPGYMSSFLVMSLILDKQPALKNVHPQGMVTVLIAAYNEADKIYQTLSYVNQQDYDGQIKVLVVNNASTDETVDEVERARVDMDLDIKVLHEQKQGKFHALNYGLNHIHTEYVITLDADTVLHKSAVRYIVARMESSPEDVCAVAGSVLAKNSRDNMLTKLQEWDYFLGISSVKRLQGLYQGTLVAQGAFSIYKTSVVQEVEGWPDAIGEDIVLTWKMLYRGYRVYFEPLAVAFTEVPNKLKHFIVQRSRWARGMIEGLETVKPWQQPTAYTKYLTGINFFMPLVDFTFTFCWIPGFILALFGYYFIVGPMTLLVLPLTIMTYSLLYYFQKRQVFDKLNLKVRKNILGLILFTLFYQWLMSPISVYGYIAAFFNAKRRWK